MSFYTATWLTFKSYTDFQCYKKHTNDFINTCINFLNNKIKIIFKCSKFVSNTAYQKQNHHLNHCTIVKLRGEIFPNNKTIAKNNKLTVNWNLILSKTLVQGFAAFPGDFMHQIRTKKPKKLEHQSALHIQWNLVIKRSDITKPSYNKVNLLVPALYIS